MTRSWIGTRLLVALLGLLSVGVLAEPMRPIPTVAMAFASAPMAAGSVIAVGAQFGQIADRADDQRFLDGLRSRGLFELGEAFCAQRLAERELLPEDRAWLTAELSRTLAQHAANSPQEERSALWDRAQQVVRQLVASNPQDPFALPLQLQALRVGVDRAELLREEAEVLPGAQARLQQTIPLLQQAQRGLEQLAGEVESRLRGSSPPGQDGAGTQLSQAQLTELLRQIEFQLARTQRNLGQCHPAGSADRAAALSQAAASLDRLAGLPADHPLAWPSRLDQARCLRLLGDYPAAASRLQATLQADPPPDIRLQTRAEQIELALDQGRLSEAITLAGEGRQMDRAGNPLLDLALLRLCLAAWQTSVQAGNQDQATGWQDKTNQMATLIRQQHSPYWVRRAQMLLAAHLQGESSGDVDLLVQAAENAYHSQQFDQAMAAYDRAAARAAQAGQDERAFQLAFTAATIEHRRNRHQQAAERYRRLALQMPDQQRAPEAHLLALYHVAQLADENPNGIVPLYEELAQEHLRTWPQTATADEVRWCLGRLREAQRKFPEALELYRAIDAGFAKYEQVVRAACHAWELLLDQASATDRPPPEAIEQGIWWFRSLIEGPNGQLPEQWSSTQLWAAVAEARLELSLQSPRYDRIEQLLRAALSQSSPGNLSWREPALRLLVECLALQSRNGDALAFARQLAESEPVALVGLIDRLGRRTQADPRQQAALRSMEAELLGVLAAQRHRLTSEQQQQLDRSYAGVLAEGHPAQTLPTLRSLASGYPDDVAIQQAYARCLLRAGSAATVEEAASAWRRLEKLAQPETDAWFQAKVALAALHLQAGEIEQAERIVRFVNLMYPTESLADRPAVAGLLDTLPAELRGRLLELLAGTGENAGSRR